MYRKEKKYIKIILFILILFFRILYYSQNIFVTYTNDSTGYMEHSLMQVVTDIWPRTPIYPFINALAELFLGELASYFVVALQIIASMIAVVYFFRILTLFGLRKWITYIGTFLYGISPSVTGFDQCILTESFALSGIVFFLYYIISYIMTGDLKKGIIAMVIVFILTFLRPSSLVFIYILFAFSVLKLILYRTGNDIKFFLVNTGIVVIILLYSVQFERQYGIFSISDPMPRNLLFLSMEQGFYKHSDSDAFVYSIDESMIANGGMNWNAMTDVYTQFQPKEIQDLALNSILNSLPEYCEYLKTCIREYSANVLWGYNTKKTENSFIREALNKTRIFYGKHAFWAVFIEFTIAVCLWIQKKEIPWLHLGLGTFILSILCLSFLTAPGEFSRLTILVVPFLHLLLPLYCDRVITKICDRRNAKT